MDGEVVGVGGLCVDLQSASVSRVSTQRGTCLVLHAVSHALSNLLVAAVAVAKLGDEDGSQQFGWGRRLRDSIGEDSTTYKQRGQHRPFEESTPQILASPPCPTRIR